MWPFRKKIIPEPITHDGVTAEFAAYLEQWVFMVGDFEFMLDGPSFNTDAIGWAKEIEPALKNIVPRLSEEVKKTLNFEGVKMNLESVELLNIDLSDFAESHTYSVAFNGDDSWGDMGVDITLKGDEIIAVEAGD